MDLRKLKVGDVIEFKSPTRSHYKKARRKITGITDVNVTVTQYHGWKNFVVFPHEIIQKEVE